MILVLGGTSESRDVAVELNNAKYRVIYVSTTGLIDDLPESVNRITRILTPETFRIAYSKCRDPVYFGCNTSLCSRDFWLSY